MDFGETIVALAGILVGGTFLILPVAVLAIRYGVRPLVDSWVRAREMPLADERMRMMERRVSLLEEQVQILERDNQRLAEQADFELRLSRPDTAVGVGRGL